jgi:integrating conjugative element protein (TIGR03765 family)
MKGHRSRLLNGLLLLLALPVTAFAQLTVLYDSGRTLPIAPYLESLQPIAAKGQSAKVGNPSSETERLGAAQISNLLPIRSPGLSPGEASSTTLSRETLTRLAQGNARPFFLVGSDALSQRWLMTHRAQLKKIGAVGLLIQAETEADLRRMAEIAQGLPMTPGSGTDIAQALGIRHYPLLISSGGITQ